jgi:cysteine synthase A
MLVVTPEGFSGERIAISQAYGAEVLQVGRFQADEAVERAREMGERAGYFFPAQFESEWNVEENRTILGPEILAQLPEGAVPDAVVAGVGTGGTLLGVGQAFRELNPDVKLFAMEPSESATILCGEVGDHLIEGIADGFVPGIFERHGRLVSETLTVDSEEAVEAMRGLARQYGLFVGPSSGANLLAARKVKEAFPDLRTVVTFFCDEGEKYIQEHFAKTGEVRVNAEKFA